ncbi:hypothetical protein HanXRQr2_CPg0837021 (chloroplast) [Helianthus annuus]|uniref:Uncharacterized protein n=1 Tax=Helianthus annuus TaxID=4232 RepID=A0A9K3DFY0_HELAN|nr:hypothetical protein HanXRQr2_CPg0837021 [Helianthus annuus]KAJ0813938.1 hypothetical protein HanPSC8_Chr17g0779461 [Helianthus annuus]
MSILDYSKLTHFLYITLQQLSSFIDIDWAENWRYIENSFHIVNKLRSQKVIQKFLTRNQLV